MNREEARAQLDATTLRPNDATYEARALAQTDPELGAWLERRTAFDKKVATAMDDLPVPGNIPAQLLAAMNAEAAKTAKRRTFSAMPLTWMAVAAVMLFIFTGWWMLRPEGADWESQAIAKVNLIEHGMMRLDHALPKLEDLKRTLASAGSLAPDQLPATLANLRTYGCKVIEVAGKPATVICFEMASGEEAHLVVLEQGTLPNLPAQTAPQFAQRGEWQLASWTDGTRGLVLMTRASPDKLKALFAGLLPASEQARRVA